MREERVAGIIAEGELQNAHSGKAELFAQRRHLVSDYSQVFGQERQAAHRPARAFE